MGYMGFGMRKEVYTRRPKTSFSKMKKIYGDHLEDFRANKTAKGEWSDKDKEEFKRIVADKIKRHNALEGLGNAVVFMLILVIVAFAIYLAFSW